MADTDVYWQLSSSGAPRDGQYRWMASVELEALEWWELCSATMLPSWDPRTPVVCETPGPPEDMPWTDFDIPVVSARLKSLLEKHEPLCAQFLAVRMQHAGADLMVEPYWIANWLMSCDCIDWANSLYESNHLKPGEYTFYRVVVDPSKCGDFRIFRIRDYRVQTIVRDDLRSILDDYGITGCQYTKLWHSHDDLPETDFDPDAFTDCGYWVEQAAPADRIGALDEFCAKNIQDAVSSAHGRLEAQRLRRLVTRLGRAVGVDWGPGRVGKLCEDFLEAEVGQTRTYLLVVQLDQERRLVVFHYYVEAVDRIRFGYWGPDEFVVKVRQCIDDLDGD